MVAGEPELGGEAERNFWTRDSAALWAWLPLLPPFFATTPRVSPRGNSCRFMCCTFYRAHSDGTGIKTEARCWWEPCKRFLEFGVSAPARQLALMWFRSAISKLLSCCFSPRIEKPVEPDADRAFFSSPGETSLTTRETRQER
jgi:hypothetical protein